MCVFCEIAEGRRRAQVIWQDEVCVAFLDMDPINEGHVLLIPRAHGLDADDLPEATCTHMMRVARRIVAALKRVYHPDGYSIMQNGGRFNEIGHYHMHIFPRYERDGFGWTSGSEAHAHGEEVARRIRREM